MKCMHTHKQNHMKLDMMIGWQNVADILKIILLTTLRLIFEVFYSIVFLNVLFLIKMVQIICIYIQLL